MKAGLTDEQIRFLNAMPWRNSVRVLQGNPYIPGVIVTATLNAAFGHDGWSDDIVAESHESFVEGEVVRVVSCCRVTIEVSRRDTHGHIVADAPTFSRAGVGTHTGKVTQKSLVGVAIDNARAAAYTKALRNAAILFGPIFGLYVMRLRKNAGNRPVAWQNFTSHERPSPPRFPGIDIGEAPTQFDASTLQDEGDSEGDQSLNEHLGQPTTPQQPQQQPQQPQQDGRGHAPPTFADGKTKVVEWCNLDGSVARRFTGDPAASAERLSSLGAKGVTVFDRQLGMEEAGEVRLNSPQGEQQPQQQQPQQQQSESQGEQDRTALVRACREQFRRLGRDKFDPVVRRVTVATGGPEIGAESIGKPEAAGGITTAVLAAVLAELLETS